MDLTHQNYNSVQSNKQPLPATIASAAAISPTTKFTFVTGTVTIATITPPTTGYCEITLCFITASPGVFLTSGNIQIAYQPIINRPVDLCWDPSTSKWWVKAVV